MKEQEKIKNRGYVSYSYKNKHVVYEIPMEQERFTVGEESSTCDVKIMGQHGYGMLMSIGVFLDKDLMDQDPSCTQHKEGTVFLRGNIMNDVGFYTQILHNTEITLYLNGKKSSHKFIYLKKILYHYSGTIDTSSINDNACDEPCDESYDEEIESTQDYNDNSAIYLVENNQQPNNTIEQTTIADFFSKKRKH
jgi:hypothetical protein